MTDTTDTTSPQDARPLDPEGSLYGMLDVEPDNVARSAMIVSHILEQQYPDQEISYAVALTPMVIPSPDGQQQVRPVIFIALTVRAENGQEYSGNVTIGLMRPEYEQLAPEVTKTIQGLLQALSSPLVVPQQSGLILPHQH